MSLPARTTYCIDTYLKEKSHYSILHGVIRRTSWAPIIMSTLLCQMTDFGNGLSWEMMTSLETDNLTHWGRVTHICVSELPIIGSDNGLSPGRRQAIILTKAGILLVRTLGINFSEILSEIHTFSFKKCIWTCLENGGHFVSASMC